MAAGPGLTSDEKASARRVHKRCKEIEVWSKKRQLTLSKQQKEQQGGIIPLSPPMAVQKDGRRWKKMEERNIPYIHSWPKV
jgi:hypothetical protein